MEMINQSIKKLKVSVQMGQKCEKTSKIGKRYS